MQVNLDWRTWIRSIIIRMVFFPYNIILTFYYEFQFDRQNSSPKIYST